MNRGHDRADYMDLIDRVKRIIPDCAISQDIMAGFPTETEEDHEETLSLMSQVRYNFGYMFAYSERPNTMAARKLEDDVPLAVKKRRLQEIIDLQQVHSAERNAANVGQVVEVLIEGYSKRSDKDVFGRTSQNAVAVFPKKHHQPGDLVKVLIRSSTAATLLGDSIDTPS